MTFQLVYGLAGADLRRPGSSSAMRVQVVMANFQINSDSGGGAQPLYFGLGPLAKFIIDKIVLPSALSTTGIDEDQIGPSPEQRYFAIQERARIQAMSDAELHAYLLSDEADVVTRQAYQRYLLTHPPLGALTMPPMWNRDP